MRAFCSSSRAVIAKVCMLASRLVSPVSRVACSFRFSLDIATHVWPAALPYALPVGPAAPVSLSPQVVLSRFLLVSARRAAYGSLADRMRG